MLDAAGIHTGSAVLDVAAGAGGQSLTAARRVGPAGRVLATDISPVILRYAAAAAAAAGLTTVQIRQLDAEQLDVEPAEFDAVISRLGLMYLPDQPRALAGMHRALRPGGRIAAVVFSTPERNSFFCPPGLHRPSASTTGPARTRPTRTIQPRRTRRARTAPPPGRIQRRRHATARRPTAAAARRRMRPFPPRVRRRTTPDARRPLTPNDRHLAWQEIHTELSRFEQPDGFQGPCELLVAWGTKRTSDNAATDAQ